MKKLVALILVITSLCPLCVQAEDAFREYAVSTLEYEAALADRIEALSKIANPTELHMELCFRYWRLWFELGDVMSMEAMVMSGGDMPETSDMTSITELIETYRTFYKYGMYTPRDIIDIIADGMPKAK